MVKKPQIKKLMFSKTAMMLLFVLLTSATAWAEKGDVVGSGTCGDNLTWTLTENGEADFTYTGRTRTPLTLTITGTGAMTDYGFGDTPWWSNSIAITHLELPEGLTHVGKLAFELSSFIQSVTLPASVTSIGESAFSSVGCETSNGCTFTAAKGSKLTSIASAAFDDFGGNVDLRNCTSLTTIGWKAFEGYKTNTVYLPISIRTIEKDAFYSVIITDKPTVRVSYKNSVLYVNGAFKAFSTTAMNTIITSFLNLKRKSSDAVSINQIFPDEIKLTFDETDHSFIIANEDDFENFGNYVNDNTEHKCEGVKFKLTSDLDFSNVNFVPIGNGTNGRFAGHFDGQGHTISNISYDIPKHLVGLFPVIINANTIIENVTLVNPELRGYGNIGGIVGLLKAGTVRNCNVVGGIISGDIEHVGGIVGDCSYSDDSDVKTISNCTVVGTIINAPESVGCIVGFNSISAPVAALTISNCLYDVASNENICSSQFTDGGGNAPLYRLNLGFGVTSDALTYGDYTVATQGSIIKLEANNRDGYEFGGFNSDDVTIENGQFTMPDKSVSVTAKWEPKNEISLKASMIDGLCWSTFYCGDAGYRIADGEEACAYTATVSDDKIILHMLGRVIPKGTAVIIVGEDNSISMTRDDVSAAEYSSVNDLNGVDLPTARTSLTSNDSYRLYMLSNKNNNFGFHSFAAANVPARKAFFTVPASANARSFSMVFDEEATAIRQLRKTVAESPVYDLNGRVVRGNNLKPGVYVKNGKKVVVK
jgi:hypothetical protein